MIILVMNSGSSSLKYQLIDMDKKEVIAKGVVERIGFEDASFKLTAGDVKKSDVLPIKDHAEAVSVVVRGMTEGENPVLHNFDDIDGIGQRVLRGDETITGSTLIDENVEGIIKKVFDISPLHNPAAYAAIQACKQYLPGVPQVAVFDTSFHATIDQTHFMYGLPYEDYEKYQVRRYGFHGTSHKYVTRRYAELMGKDLKDVNIITCHLGNGSSVSAIKNGKVMDTSMGFTPQEGPLMGTRVGNIDSTAILYLMKQKGFSIEEMDNYVNKQGGLLGVSGVSNDFRDLEDAMDAGNERAKLAFDMFVLGIKRYIGMYLAEMNGCDAIVFTAGIGENDGRVREAICADMDYLGLAIDVEKNDGNREESEITGEGSKIRVFIIPTDEEMEIAQDCVDILSK